MKKSQQCKSLSMFLYGISIYIFTFRSPLKVEINVSNDHFIRPMKWSFEQKAVFKILNDLHLLHSFVFSPVWVFKCALKLPAHEKA